MTWDDPLGNASWFRGFVNVPRGKLTDVWGQEEQYQIANTLSSGAYSFWVYSWNHYGDDGWAGPGSFEIDKALPLKIATISPSGSETTADRRPEFSWQADDNTSWYKVVVRAEDGSISHSAWIKAPLTEWTPDFDLKGGEYKWWIVGWKVTS